MSKNYSDLLYNFSSGVLGDTNGIDIYDSTGFTTIENSKDQPFLGELIEKAIIPNNINDEEALKDVGDIDEIMEICSIESMDYVELARKSIFDAICASNINDLKRWLESTNLGTCSMYGTTALHKAAAFGPLEAVRLLLDYGANIDGLDLEEATPLHYAVLSKKPDIVALLLASGADPDALTKYKESPLILALTECPLASLEKMAHLRYLPINEDYYIAKYGSLEPSEQIIGSLIKYTRAKIICPKSYDSIKKELIQVAIEKIKAYRRSNILK